MFCEIYNSVFDLNALLRVDLIEPKQKAANTQWSETE